MCNGTCPNEDEICVARDGNVCECSDDPCDALYEQMSDTLDEQRECQQDACDAGHGEGDSEYRICEVRAQVDSMGAASHSDCVDTDEILDFQMTVIDDLAGAGC